MEAFFNERENRGIKPGAYTDDAAFMREFGMELIGPGVMVGKGVLPRLQDFAERHNTGPESSPTAQHLVKGPGQPFFYSSSIF
jgi:hypothetical protein